MPQQQEKSILIIGIIAVLLILGVVTYFAIMDDWGSGEKPGTTNGEEPTPVPNPIGETPVVPGEEVPPAPGSSGTPPSASGWNTYRSAKFGFSIRYPDRYFISNTTETPEGTFIRVNKTSDRAKVDDLVLDRTAHMQFVVLTNKTGITLQGLAQLWGEAQAGSRFRTGDSCKPRTIAGEGGLYCTFYAGTEHGGYRKSAFVSHAGRVYRFDVGSVTNNDAIQRDFDGVLSTVAWTQ